MTLWTLHRASFMSDRPSPKARDVSHRLVTPGSTDGKLSATLAERAVRMIPGSEELRVPRPRLACCPVGALNGELDGISSPGHGPK